MCWRGPGEGTLRLAANLVNNNRIYVQIQRVICLFKLLPVSVVDNL
jgi:hypothetical protein